MKLKFLEKSTFVNIWLFLLTFCLFFPLRKVFVNASSFYLGNYSDFTTISFYSTDFLVIIGLLYSIWSGEIKKIKKIKLPYIFLFISLVASAIFNFKTLSSINYFFIFQISISIVLHATIYSFYEYIKVYKFIFYFTIFCFLESLLALYQFSQQSSLGLYRLGESHLDSILPNIARILTEEIIFLRSYGTFPHPNIASAFFACGLVFCLLLYINGKKSKENIFYLIVSGGTLVGLVLTFSRAGILATIASLNLVGIILLFKFKQTKKILLFGFFVVTIALTSVFYLKNLYITRANVFDQSTAERTTYNNIGVTMAKHNFLFGVGPGNSILQMKNYSNKALKEWEHQPIHNYYLLTLAEGGIFFVIALLSLLFLPFLPLFKRNSQLIPFEQNQNMIFHHVVVIVIPLLFSILMLFDHYLYTIEQSRLLMWVLLGFSAAAHQKSTDSAIEAKQSNHIESA